MAAAIGERYDSFLSRRNSVAAFTREVADVLRKRSYEVLVQHYDAPFAANFS